MNITKLLVSTTALISVFAGLANAEMSATTVVALQLKLAEV